MRTRTKVILWRISHIYFFTNTTLNTQKKCLSGSWSALTHSSPQIKVIHTHSTHTHRFTFIKSQKSSYYSTVWANTWSREMSLWCLLNTPCSVTTQRPAGTVYIPPICCICLFFHLFSLTSPHPFLRCSLLRSQKRSQRLKKTSVFFVNKCFIWTHWKLLFQQVWNIEEETRWHNGKRGGRMIFHQLRVEMENTLISEKKREK